MSRNGAGVYTLPAGSTVANGDTSDATDINTPLADLETDANTARPIVAGGTGATTASGARTNFGLSIGSDIQAYDALLAALAALVTSADKMLYFTGSDAVSLTDLTAAGRALLDDASASAQRTTLGLGGLATLDILDEDNMATNSATRPPSQQSTKAYVDSQALAVGQTITDVTGSRSLNMSYENTGSRTITAYVSVDPTSSLDAQLSANGSTWVTVQNHDADRTAQMTATLIIAPGNFYRIGTGAQTGNITAWAEVS